MATSSTPGCAWLATLLTLANGGTNQSASQTATLQLTAAWEIQIPILFSHGASISSDPIINVYASMDGGVVFDSSPFISMALPRVSGGGGRQISLRLTTGHYAIQMLNSGPTSAFFGMTTQLLVSAIANV